MGDVIDLVSAKEKRADGEAIAEIERLAIIADARERIMTSLIAGNIQVYESLVAMNQIIVAALSDMQVTRAELDKDTEYYF
jgi:hypothetical protein